MAEFSLFGRDLFGEPVKPKPSGVLADRFCAPPFSVLNARDGNWQARKKAWISLGLRSEIGRGDVLGLSEQARKYAGGYEVDGEVTKASGASIFDPVLTELAYRWFCPPMGYVLDPFAGGSVRGVVAAALGRRYLGMDLRQEQISANEQQWSDVVGYLSPGTPSPKWVCGDSQSIGTETPDVEADFVFSCPPYANLEVYSDNPQDLSTMAYPQFLDAYRRIIAASVARLKTDRFACFVVGEVRDSKGYYINLVSETIAAFESAGTRYYNEAILVTVCGSLPIRAGRAFVGGKKLGKSHQNVLVFCKGDWKKASDAVGNADA